jgi:hypothetical protein
MTTFMKSLPIQIDPVWWTDEMIRLTGDAEANHAEVIDSITAQVHVAFIIGGCCPCHTDEHRQSQSVGDTLRELGLIE